MNIDVQSNIGNSSRETYTNKCSNNCKNACKNADRLSAFMSSLIIKLVGHWIYIGVEAFIIGLWITLNSTGVIDIDKSPFIILTLVIQFLTEYMATFEVLAQNTTRIAEREQAKQHKIVIEHISRLTDILQSKINPTIEVINQLIIKSKTLLTVDQKIIPRFYRVNSNLSGTNDILGENTIGRCDRFTEWLSGYIRSWKYIITITIFIILWIVCNLKEIAIDPYPFLYLNIGLGIWTLLQESFIVKITTIRSIQDIERNGIMYSLNLEIMKNITNLVIDKYIPMIDGILSSENKLYQATETI